MQISRGTQHTQIQIPITNPDFPSPTRQACPHLPRLALTTTLARTHARRRCREATHRARRASERAPSPTDLACNATHHRQPSQATAPFAPGAAAGLLPRVAPVPISPGPTCAPAFPLAFPFSLWEARNTQRERERWSTTVSPKEREARCTSRVAFTPPTGTPRRRARQVCDGARVAVEAPCARHQRRGAQVCARRNREKEVTGQWRVASPSWNAQATTMPAH